MRGRDRLEEAPGREGRAADDGAVFPLAGAVVAVRREEGFDAVGPGDGLLEGAEPGRVLVGGVRTTAPVGGSG